MENGNADWKSLSEKCRRICSEYCIEPVWIKTNIIDGFYSSAHDAVVSYVNAAVALSLQKMVSNYYISSGYTYDEFELVGHSSEKADPLLVHCLATENTNFYVIGAELTRSEKTIYISDNRIAQKELFVCRYVNSVNGKICNDSRCSKCTRTMIDLDIIGKLDNFRDVFDIDRYRKEKNYYWGYLIYKGKKDEYTNSTLNMMKKYNIKMPICAYASGLLKIIKNGFRRSNPDKYNFRP
ncbi:MAG: hypothetical protein K6F35_09510 [Lachnospiraceae bacterium]|nr:hypothetical protein [Lachnospiraceae bacterium]